MPIQTSEVSPNKDLCFNPFISNLKTSSHKGFAKQWSFFTSCSEQQSRFAVPSMRDVRPSPPPAPPGGPPPPRVGPLSPSRPTGRIDVPGDAGPSGSAPWLCGAHPTSDRNAPNPPLHGSGHKHYRFLPHVISRKITAQTMSINVKLLRPKFGVHLAPGCREAIPEVHFGKDCKLS